MRLMTLAVAMLAIGCAGAAAKPRFKVLQDLGEANAGVPEFPPIIGQDGALYGTTYTYNNGGGIYSISTTGKNFALLYMFPGGAGGSGPFGGLVQDASGLFYGTTLAGGTSGQGTVYQFDAATRSVTILHSFDIADGSTPYAGLVQDAAGNLYGTTSAGGTKNLGTIYEIAAVTHAFTKLADLDGKSGGSSYAPLLIGSDGMLYGTGTGSGPGGGGTGAIFRVPPEGGKVEAIHQFAGKDGSGPFSGLAEGVGGVLYGTTDVGGSDNVGVVFALTLASGKLTVLHDFKTSDGADPQATVVLDGAGRVLGTTFYGGSGNAGVIYRLDPATSKFAVLHNFNENQAGVTNAGLTYAGGKTFFGGTALGGGGTVFRFGE